MGYAGMILSEVAPDNRNGKTADLQLSIAFEIFQVILK